MDVIRDLLRDFVGILFPGGLFVILTSWLFWGGLSFIDSVELSTVFPVLNNLIIFSGLLIFSYIAGQALRMKRLDGIERKCTKVYRKKRIEKYLKDYVEIIEDVNKIDKENQNKDKSVSSEKGKLGSSEKDTTMKSKEDDSVSPGRIRVLIHKIIRPFVNIRRFVQRKAMIKEYMDIMREKFEKSIEELDQKDDEYNKDILDPEELKKAYNLYNFAYGVWEEFPYPNRSKWRRLSFQSDNYNEFFEKYDKQGITKSRVFFHFCKSVVYQYSPSFKEELVRQESLVRLFAGVLHLSMYGLIISFIVGMLHLGAILDFLSTPVGAASSEILLAVSVFTFLALFYLRREILHRLRAMRVKEINLAFDAFYLICTKEKFDL